VNALGIAWGRARSSGRRFVAVVALLAAIAPHAHSQRTEPDLPDGTRIRIRAQDAGVPWTTTAIVDSLGRDTRWVRQLGDPPPLRTVPRLAVPLHAVTRLELDTGRASRWSRARKGALRALLVWGVVAGA
jgi:hypothetical protein